MKFPTDKPIVCVQGLGFVGAAMSIAIANAKDEAGVPFFNVYGVDLDNELGQKKVNSINQGILPLTTNDQSLSNAFNTAIKQKNLRATTSTEVYSFADVVVVDIHCDIDFTKADPQLKLEGLKQSISLLGASMKENSLILVETTVPPGTCEKVLQPMLENELINRGLKPSAISLAHSYERVMPGKDYYNSIVNFWRVYSSNTETGKKLCREFLEKIINTKDYPMTELNSTTESETAKVLENSYRAVNIAFMEEWGNFAESINIDLFKIIDAIRMRPTHNNIRQPGFAVGGYCLTKDPLFAKAAASQIYSQSHSFPFSSLAVKTNYKMPLNTLNVLKRNNNIKNVLLLGISYRQDVADTRYSGAELFYDEATKEGYVVDVHDPIVGYWEEKDLVIDKNLSGLDKYDAIIFAVPHNEYVTENWGELLQGFKGLLIDANNVLNEKTRQLLLKSNAKLYSIGRGEML